VAVSDPRNGTAWLVRDVEADEMAAEVGDVGDFNA
jgi:hypothetical protein